MKKYWENHDFHPIHCKYYDNEKENKFLKNRIE